MLRGSAAALAAILVLVGPAWAQQMDQPGQEWQQRGARFGAVVVQNQPIFALAAVANYSPEERAEEVRRRILRVLAPKQAGQTTISRYSQRDVTTARMGNSWVVNFGGIPVATVTPADVRAHGVAGQALAQQWADQLKTALFERLNITPQTAYNELAASFQVAVGSAQQIASGQLQGVGGFSADEQLAYNVREQLARDPNLSPVEVSVLNGVVTIRGTVPNTAAEQRAVDAIENVEGVQEVRSDLRIRGR